MNGRSWSVCEMGRPRAFDSNFTQISQEGAVAHERLVPGRMLLEPPSCWFSLVSVVGPIPPCWTSPGVPKSRHSSMLAS